MGLETESALGLWLPWQRRPSGRWQVLPPAWPAPTAPGQRPHGQRPAPLAEVQATLMDQWFHTFFWHPGGGVDHEPGSLRESAFNVVAPFDGTYDSNTVFAAETHVDQYMALGAGALAPVVMVMDWGGLAAGSFYTHIHNATIKYKLVAQDRGLPWMYGVDLGGLGGTASLITSELDYLKAMSLEDGYYTDPVTGRPCVYMYHTTCKQSGSAPIVVAGAMNPIYQDLIDFGFDVTLDRGGSDPITVALSGPGLAWAYYGVFSNTDENMVNHIALALANENLAVRLPHWHGYDNRGLKQNCTGFDCLDANANALAYMGGPQVCRTGWRIWPSVQNEGPEWGGGASSPIGGSSLAWYDYQWDLHVAPHLLHPRVRGVVRTWNENGEHTTTPPTRTDPASGNSCGAVGFGTTMYDRTRERVLALGASV